MTMERGKRLSPEAVDRLRRPMLDPQEVLSAAAWQKRNGDGDWLNITVNKPSDLPEELEGLRRAGWQLRPLYSTLTRLKEPNMSERECSHNRAFKARCIECELIMAREALAHAKDNLEKYSKLVVKLEAEKHLADQLVR